MIPPRDYSKPPVTGPKETEIQELSKKEFKIIVQKLLRVLQDNADTQFNDIFKILEQNEKFNKRIHKKEPNRNCEAEEYD